jgi:choice-of-anchor B domain-containing protein
MRTLPPLAAAGDRQTGIVPAFLLLGILLFTLIVLDALPALGEKRVTLLGQLDLAAGSVVNSDVWGWVDPSTNKEYAIVGEHPPGKVNIVDVSDPSNPFVAGLIPLAPGFDIKTWQHYLYLVDGDGNNDDGEIYDISDPTQPVLIGTFLSAHNIFITDNGTMYNCVNGVTILDLTPDPTAPSFVWTDRTSGGHDATVVGNRLYDFHGTSGTFIYALGGPVPLSLGNISHPDITFHHSGWPSADGKHLFLNDELSNSAQADITVWNITNPAVPFKVWEFADPTSKMHNSYRVGDYLYCSFYTAGFRVFDVSNPLSPALVGEYDTAPGLSGNTLFRGAWGCYPFAPSGNIYVSDTDAGLFVFSFGEVLSVAISAFDAEPTDEGVRLTWAIGGADDLAGFHIYRSAGNEERFTRLNVRILAPDGIEYVDSTVEPGTVYRYRLGAVDRDGEFFSRTIDVTTPEAVLELRQNYPNPFNPTTTIGYVLPRGGQARLVVYDGKGRSVRTLIDGSQPAGRHAVAWDGRDNGGRDVASGVYFYELQALGVTESRRMVFLK